MRDQTIDMGVDDMGVDMGVDMGRSSTAALLIGLACHLRRSRTNHKPRREHDGVTPGLCRLAPKCFNPERTERNREDT